MMIGNAAVQLSTCPGMLTSSPFIGGQYISRNYLPRIPCRSQRKLFRVRTAASDKGYSTQPSSSEPKVPLTAILEVPRTLWKQIERPLRDFGFGSRSLWEGGVGLFLVSGAVLFALTIAWLRGFQLRSRFRKYLAVFEFSQACGLSTGTPVRIRGVTIGNVVRVNPSLRSIEATVEVEDDKIIIPRNSLVEVNQSGLLMEPLIDITPRDPIPTPKVGPRDPECLKEGLIVCDRQKMRGCQGVSLDEMVGIYTRLGREAEKIGMAKSFALAERVASVIEEARPLLSKIEAMTEDIQPLLSELHNSGLLMEVKSLTKSLTRASEDLRRANASVMTPENTELLQKTIHSLVFTLKNIESISSDVLGFTGDEATRRNLKLLIKSLSRML